MNTTSTKHMGKIYANWCPHCVALEPEWNKMKEILKNHKTAKNSKVNFIEIEQSQMEEKIPEVNEVILKDSAEKLSGDKGFPTIFCIYGKKINYYNGIRDANNMTEWVLSINNTRKKKFQTGGTRNHRKKRKSRYLHPCTFKTPPKGGVISEQGDADCAFLMRNGVKIKTRKNTPFYAV
jgi:thiol-disulfide isomerase/thioredoxin